MEKAERQENHKAIDEIFWKMDRLYSAGKFEEAGEVLKNVDIESCNLTIICCWLTVAHLPYNVGDQDKVPGLAEFNARCAAEVRKRDPERADRLLQGFRV